MKMSKLLPKRLKDANKGTFGTVLNVSGSEMYSGAGVLSSLAALKAGAGKVILCSSQNTLFTASVSAPEVVLMNRESISFNNVTSVLLGCGLSTDENAVKIFEKVIQSSRDIPLIIDADGLNILAQKDYILPKNTILTPHPKEMSRLMKVTVEDVLKNSKAILKNCVQKYNATVVLKLHQTTVMNYEQEDIYVNKTGNTALSKAGSGDVLSGIIAGFLAQGLNCYNAAILGVYVHGLAGEIASETLSEYSVLATDILKYLGPTLKKLS